MRRRTPEERYKDLIRTQRRTLEDFLEQEIDWANSLLMLYRCKKQEIPDDEYRVCAFFLNKEFVRKPGSLALLYGTFMSCQDELPKVTKENAFDVLAYRYRVYAQALRTGGFDG